MRTRGHDNGIFTFTLESQWEVAIANLVSLSTKISMGGIDVEYAVIKDFCKAYSLDAIETYATVRGIAAAVYKKEE